MTATLLTATSLLEAIKLAYETSDLSTVHIETPDKSLHEYMRDDTEYGMVLEAIRMIYPESHYNFVVKDGIIKMQRKSIYDIVNQIIAAFKAKGYEKHGRDVLEEGIRSLLRVSKRFDDERLRDDIVSRIMHDNYPIKFIVETIIKPSCYYHVRSKVKAAVGETLTEDKITEIADNEVAKLG